MHNVTMVTASPKQQVELVMRNRGCHVHSMTSSRVQTDTSAHVMDFWIISI